MVLGVAKSKNGQLMISGSKDTTAFVWQQSASTGRFQKIGECSGHTETVSAVAFSQKTTSFVITGSQDMTIKLWDLEPLNGSFFLHHNFCGSFNQLL
jgi:U3 small nucleolar RNA-associated protein 13